MKERYQREQICYNCNRTSKMGGKPGPCPYCGSGNTWRVKK